MIFYISDSDDAEPQKVNVIKRSDEDSDKVLQLKNELNREIY